MNRSDENLQVESPQSCESSHSCEERLKPETQDEKKSSVNTTSPPRQTRNKCSFFITDILAETNERITDSSETTRDSIVHHRHFIPLRNGDSDVLIPKTNSYSRHGESSGNYK